MAREEEHKEPKRAFLIVCEGEKTEPAFFTALTDEETGLADTSIKYTIFPIFEEKKDINKDRGRYKGKKKPTKTPIVNPFQGIAPTKWVQFAIDRNVQQIYYESWVVYDKDNHPEHKKAYELAKANGIGFGFSSRSFEYYGLLHYQYIFKTFLETECKGYNPNHKGADKDHREFWCGIVTDPNIREEKYIEKDCHGQTCINGYARENGYWQNSKRGELLHSIDKETLIKGINNAVRLRYESKLKYPAVEDYDRNPYVTVDQLVQRIINVESVEIGEEYCAAHKLFYKYESGNLIVRNEGKKRVILSKDLIKVFNEDDGTNRNLLSDRVIIGEGESRLFAVDLQPNEHLRLEDNGKIVILVGENIPPEADNKNLP